MLHVQIDKTVCPFKKALPAEPPHVHATDVNDSKHGICPPFAVAILIFLVLLLLQSLLKFFPMPLLLVDFF